MTTQYDYVIVGAGSAGCVMAGRLADACPDATIALLEAGPPDDSVLVRTPLGIAALISYRTRFNWMFRTAPQRALHNRKTWQPRGRGLGGSSSINAMIYTRGHAGDYDDWAALGCPGWRYNDVLPYFIRAEANARGADAFHGASGPLSVQDLRHVNPYSRHFIEAARQAGFPLNEDFNGATQEGIGLYQVTQRDGERWNAARAYLHDRPRSNLHVLTQAHALRIRFDGKQADAVEFTRAGKTDTIRARCEIIVSSGAFGSPQLLMCSGVGPAAALQALGIPVIHDAPQVGQDLQDHVDFTVQKRLPDRDLVGLSLGSVPAWLASLRDYRQRRDGMFSSNIAEAGGFIKSDPSLERPDLQLHFCTAMVDQHGRTLHWGHGYSIHVCVLRPRSRGSVDIKSADTRVAPRIDPRFLSDPADAEALLRGAKALRRILEAPALATHGGKELHTDPAQTDTQLLDTIRAYAETIYHPVGTCRMGRDANSVVDLELRVRGVTGLRVVDASVMPKLIGGNTNAPTIMIAERAVEKVLAARESPEVRAHIASGAASGACPPPAIAA